MCAYEIDSGDKGSLFPIYAVSKPWLISTQPIIKLISAKIRM